MINPLELRIGNLVDIPKIGRYPLKVESICTDIIGGKNSKENFVYYLPEDIKPIPLTEEVLLKCGFKWNDNIFEHDGHYFRFFWKNEINRMIFNQNKSISVKCEYLHQFQNLYFELTNKELEIKQ